MTTLALIQARMSSSRLPGKVLADIAGEPMIVRVVDRVRQAETIDRVAVVTSDQPDDDALARLCADRGIPCFRGSLDDVLDRFYRATLAFEGETIVRITGDCPLIDPAVIDRVVRAFELGGCDYATNTLRYTYPDGLDVEVFDRAALARAHAEAVKPSEREHVTPYLRLSGRFRTRNVEHATDLSKRGDQWCVDTADDLDFVRAVYFRLAEVPGFGFEDVLALLEREPMLLAIQAAKISNEGYYRSLYQEATLGTRQGSPPGRLIRLEGAYAFDETGNSFVDYAQSLEPVVIDFGRVETMKWLGQRLQDGLNALAAEAGLGARIGSSGHPLCASLWFADQTGADDPQLAARFADEAARRGVIVQGRHHLGAGHDDPAIEATLVAYASVLKALAAWIAEGERGRSIERVATAGRAR
ncbi:MAG: NTP transferase domain-containing protein [Dehalococcoidia bacterium]